MSGLYKSTSLWQFQTPIKQIKFAYGSFDKHASMASFKTTHVLDWFAVRTLTSTCFFANKLLEGLVYESVLHGEIFPLASALQLDMAFNPWSTREVVIIDENSTWTMYEIAGVRDTKSLTLKSCKMQIELIDWARVIWGHTRHSLVICTRSSIALHDIRVRNGNRRG